MEYYLLSYRGTLPERAQRLRSQCVLLAWLGPTTDN